MRCRIVPPIRYLAKTYAKNGQKKEGQKGEERKSMMILVRLALTIFRYLGCYI